MKKLFFGLIPWLALAMLAVALFPAGSALAAPTGPDIHAPLLGMAGFISLRNLFTADAIAQYLKVLPKLRTPVMDTVFANRPQLGLPIVGRDEVNTVVQAMPLRRRGAGSVPVPGSSGSADFYEPFPINPDIFVGAHDLNNLKLLGQSSLEAWARSKTDVLRRTIRATTEAMAAKAITGTLAWPVLLEGGGYDTYQVSFGSPLAYAPTKLFTDAGATIKDVFETLDNMAELIQDNGYGSQIEFWAGKTAYGALLGLADNHKSTAKIRVEVTSEGINIGDYLMKRRTEKNRNPQSGAMESVVADTDMLAVALDAGHLMPYTALDDLDAKLQPLPMFVKPIAKQNPSGVQLVGMSKPFPSPNMKGICKATVAA